MIYLIGIGIILCVLVLNIFKQYRALASTEGHEGILTHKHTHLHLKSSSISSLQRMIDGEQRGEGLLQPSGWFSIDQWPS